MATRLEVADVTCPASTAATAPQEVALGFPGGILRRLTIVIPDGHAGLTGIALGYAHNPTMPASKGAFISGNDEVLHYDYVDQQPGVAWSAFLCNLDTQPHTWEVRFELDEVSAPAPSVSNTPIPVTDLEAATAALLAGP